MNKRAKMNSSDVMELLKIAVIIVVGYIIVKALISAA